MEPNEKTEPSLTMQLIVTYIAARPWIWQFVFLCLTLVALILSPKGYVRESAVLVPTLILILLPGMLARWQGIRMSPIVEYGTVFIVTGTLLLGELAGLYSKLWWWDIPFHTFSGFFFAYVALTLLRARLGLAGRMNPATVACAAILISVGLSGLWEVFEFATDHVLATNLQPTEEDTMWDVIAGTFGALLVVPVGRFFMASSVQRDRLTSEGREVSAMS